MLLVTNVLLNLGELVELLLVFPVFTEVVLADLDKELSETCAEEVECSAQSRFGEDGTERSMLTNDDSLLLQLWLLQQSQLWLWPEVTESTKSQRFPSLLEMSLRTPKRHKRLWKF